MKQIKLFIVFHGDYFIIILSKFTFIIFQEREEKLDQANVAIGEAKVNEVSVFFIFLLYVITNLCYYQSKSLPIYYVMLHNIIKENKFCV